MDTDGLLALSVLGPRGMVDLMVPGEAAVGDVAAEYARSTGAAVPAALRIGLGDPVPPEVSLRATDVAAGDVLVTADLEPVGGQGVPARARPPGPVGAGAWLWVAVAAAGALVAGWYAARAADTEQTVVVNVLLVAALVGVLPGGRLSVPRGVAAPAFGAAAAYAFAWQPSVVSLPVTWGVTGLAAAATAAGARAMLPEEDTPAGGRARRDEAHLTWMVAGTLLFLVASVVAVFGLSPTVAWSALLVVAMLATRVIPALAVNVPDQMLVDLERLAVSAWSAREQPRGRRTRMVVAHGMVAGIAVRGQRVVTAAAAATALGAPTASYLLLASDLPRLDRLGAALLVLFVGASLLLVANSYRNLVARLLLRLGGLLSWLVAVVFLLPAWTEAAATWIVLASVGLTAVCVVTAVATGRGWRSVWWARRAEIAESVSGAFALGALCLSTGLFRMVWELASRFGT